MRVSEKFNLLATQGELDFVDVLIDTDVPVFIDPGAIRTQQGVWSDDCEAALQSYFGELLLAIKEDRPRVAELIYPLGEPNETHLGSSTGRSRGRGLGNKKTAQRLVENLADSKAAQTGLLEDLEDTALLVDGIGVDIISDITTSVIRLQLVAYTQAMCEFWEIPMTPQATGPIWDQSEKRWNSNYTAELPRADEDKLLLVPKSIVRATLDVDKGKYYRGYLRGYFVDDLMSRPSQEFVRVLRKDRIVPDFGRIDAYLGTTKQDIAERTQTHPEALARYRKARRSLGNPPLPDSSLRERTKTPPSDLRELLEGMKAISPGNAGAVPYQHAVAKLLTALFDAQLGSVKLEQKIHDGLKRIDVTWDNVADSGLFKWLGQHHPAGTVMGECKNYSKDVANPEFDQLLGRFSPLRGQVGLLLCRAIADKDRALKRARNSATDRHGFIIVLDDGDIEALVSEAEQHLQEGLVSPFPLSLMRERFDALVN